MIVRVPGAFLDHSRTPKPPKIVQKMPKNLFGVLRWGYLPLRAGLLVPTVSMSSGRQMQIAAPQEQNCSRLTAARTVGLLWDYAVGLPGPCGPIWVHLGPFEPIGIISAHSAPWAHWAHWALWRCALGPIALIWRTGPW